MLFALLAVVAGGAAVWLHRDGIQAMILATG
jgi:energy-converting hydrogenase Eha subunit C